MTATADLEAPLVGGTSSACPTSSFEAKKPDLLVRSDTKVLDLLGQGRLDLLDQLERGSIAEEVEHVRLDINDLSLAIGDKRILNGVQCSFKPGELVSCPALAPSRPTPAARPTVPSCSQ